MLITRGDYHIEKHVLDSIPIFLVRDQTGIPRPAIICTHGYFGSKERMFQACLSFVKAGFTTVSWDARAHGERASIQILGGIIKREFLKGMFKVFVEGLESACDVPTLVDFLDERNDVVHERIGMMGVSMGGFISLLSATREKRLKSIVSMGGGGDLENLLNKTQLLNVLPFKVLTRGIKKEVKELTDKIDPLCKLEKFFPTAILLINGSSDRIVPFECAKKLYHKLKPYYEEAPSKLVLKEYVNVGHQFTPEMYEEAISWFKRTL